MKRKSSKNDLFKIKFFLAITLIVVMATTVTYGFFISSKKQSGQNVLTSSCFNVTFTNESNSINLTNAYSVSDEVGLRNTPYAFTITNTCETAAAYRVLLSSKAGSFGDTHINTALEDGVVKTLSTYNRNTDIQVDAGYDNSYVLTTGTLNQGQSRTVNVRLWINAATTYEDVANKGWEGQIRVVSTVAGLEG